MGNKKTPFRHDYVGSFLRPQKLKEARKDFEAGKIDRAALTAVEDECIRELVAKQKELGYEVITDGEFRRATWHLDFMWAFAGIGHRPTKTGLPFHGEQAMIDDTYLTGKLYLDGEHPFVGHFRFVQTLEDDNTVAKMTIPAPAQFLAQLIMPFAVENTRKFYPEDGELIEDLVAGYKKVIEQLYEAGCRNLQLDDCTWGMLADPRVAMFYGSEEGVDRIKELYLTVNNRVLADRPADLTVNTHVCRGNFHSTYANSGAYNAVADYLLAKENVDAFYLEYDDARSGGQKPLRVVCDRSDALVDERHRQLFRKHLRVACALIIALVGVADGKIGRLDDDLRLEQIDLGERDLDPARRRQPVNGIQHKARPFT